jgi:hypothetical protein
MPKPIGIVQEKILPSIVDGKHYILTCGICDAKLVDVYLTHPNKELTMPVQAKCGKCGGFSSITEIPGLFHYGPMVENGPFAINDIEQLDDKFLFITKYTEK